jgi:hypothetical protein
MVKTLWQVSGEKKLKKINKRCWVNWISTWKKLSLEFYLTKYTIVNLSWIIVLKVNV